MHAVGARAAGHESGRPEGGLEEDLGGRVRDGGTEPSHDACDADRTAVVRDNQRVFIELDLFFVQQGQALPLVRQARPYRALQQRGIVGMQWLSEFQHHVVGDVDHG